MQSIVNFLRGYADITISGPFPERFLNICARGGVAFWALERRDDGTYTARVRANSVRYLDLLAERSGCTVEQTKRHGAPIFASRFLRRYLFLGGMVMCIAFVVFASQRVWEFEVNGNERIPTDVILRHLSDMGVAAGVRMSDIDHEDLQTRMLLAIPELRWIAVNSNGSHAVVDVRERTMKPEMIDEKQPANVTARKAGIIESIAVLEGAAQVSVGDTVEEGQLIASGVVDTAAGARIVHAMADVTAKTWYTLHAAAPLYAAEKRYEDEAVVKRAIIFGGNRINLYLNSSICFTECDKLTERTRLTLPGGLKLPIEWERSTYRAYSAQPSERDGEDMEDALKQHLLERLDADSGGAEVVETDFELEERDGMLFCTLTAVCREEIGQEVPLKFDMSLLTNSKRT